MDAWRAKGYHSTEFPTIGEILTFQPDIETGASRYLREPRLRALETYWSLYASMVRKRSFMLLVSQTGKHAENALQIGGAKRQPMAIPYVWT